MYRTLYIFQYKHLIQLSFFYLLGKHIYIYIYIEFILFIYIEFIK